jgi:hypothetical protein
MNDLKKFDTGFDEPRLDGLYGISRRSKLGVNLVYGPMLSEIRGRGVRATKRQNLLL